MTPEEQALDMMKEQVRISDKAFNFHLKRANDLMNQIDQVYRDYTGAPYEQVKHIPLANFVKTRFVTVEEHNVVCDQREAMRVVLQDIINGAAHPEVAVRRVMVDLKPIRKVLNA